MIEFAKSKRFSTSTEVLYVKSNYVRLTKKRKPLERTRGIKHSDSAIFDRSPIPDKDELKSRLILSRSPNLCKQKGRSMSEKLPTPIQNLNTNLQLRVFGGEV